MTILVGSASWTDKSLIACSRFYPPGVHTPEQRLRHYASVLPLVEVDSTYYALPSVANAQRWVARTPQGFVFNVKAFRLFTGHPTAPEALPGDIRVALAGRPATARGRMLFYRQVPAEIRLELWRRFIEAVMPLQHAGKLGVVHLQFPPWIRNDEPGRAHVAHCVAALQGCCHAAVEFRHGSWFTPAAVASTVAFERSLGAVHVVVDGPQGAINSVPAVWHATHPQLAVVRLHGRNTSAYNRSGLAASSGRFNYDYSAAELEALKPRLRALQARAGRVQVVFNNNHEDQGQRNARTLLRMLTLS
jgi:uncharacterized protein YecE (DUF72 family)